MTKTYIHHTEQVQAGVVGTRAQDIDTAIDRAIESAQEKAAKSVTVQQVIQDDILLTLNAHGLFIPVGAPTIAHIDGETFVTILGAIDETAVSYEVIASEPADAD